MYKKIVLLLCLSFAALGQDNKQDFFILADQNGLSLGQVAEQKKKDFGIDILFQNEGVKNTTVRGILVKKHFFDYVEDVFPLWSVLRISQNLYLVFENNLRPKIYDEDGKLNVFFIPSEATTASGILINKADFLPLADAVVFNQFDQSGMSVGDDGAFEVSVKSNFLNLEIRHPGVIRQNIIFLRHSSGTSDPVSISLDTKSTYLEELRVTATKADDNVSNNRSGIQKMSIRTIKQIPTFLGEIDPIRSITTLPGVTSTGDLGAGYNVRGGETSQNLILQDGAVIFNPSHLFGFFSSFNPDVIQSVQLLKGCGPSNYGGRVASVLDLRTRNGDINKFKLAGGLGLVSSRLTAEGPIQKGKSSFLISGRTSYTDWLIHQYDDIDLKNSTAKFSDLTGKLFFSVFDDDVINITGYSSGDKFRLGSSSNFSWNTNNVSANWDHKISDKVRSILSVASSNYKSSEFSEDELFGFVNANEVNVLSANLDFNYNKSEKWKISSGLSVNNYGINPGNSVPYTKRSQIEPVTLSEQKGLEFAGYFENSIDLTEKIGLDLGLRYAHFLRLGPGPIYTLDYADRDGRVPSISDSTIYGNNQLVSQNSGFEPRISMRFNLWENASMKVAYSRTQQFVQQVTPTVSPSPIDYWVLSSNNLKPQRSDQFSIGLFNNFNDNKLEASIELFYNETRNTLDYLDGVDLKLNPFYEAGLAQGLGESYGAEFFLKKRGGLVNGWISYTLSRSWRTFESEFEGQAINNGKRYPSAFDQPHQLSVVMNVSMPNRVVFSSNITYNTGRPLTIPVSKYGYADLLSINNYSDRNQFRSPDYMRLDISFAFNGKKSDDKLFSGDLIFSVFNLFARKNPYAIWFDNTGQAFKTSILGTAFPSFSYNFSIN
ncbi:MAG: hypothetical protein ACI9IP_000828 [Arcticibacterium sp.]